MPNAYCDALHIAIPRVEAVRGHPEASTYTLLIVALLERGAPMTLPEIAARFDAAGVAPAAEALRSLKRCRPARAPVYRDGDQYGLDPYDHELDLWAFRLGLRPAKVEPAFAKPAPLAPSPRAGPEQPLTIAELIEAWTNASLTSWSTLRIALAVLEAHGAPMHPHAIAAFVAARTQWHRLPPVPAATNSHHAAIVVRADGAWEIAPGAPQLAAVRNAVRDAIDSVRRGSSMRFDPVALEASMRAAEARRAAHAAELAALRRVIVHTFPARQPRAVVLVDVGGRQLSTFLGAEVAGAVQRLATFDVIAAVDVRGTLRALGIEAGDKRLAELGPPQKTLRLSRDGRTLAITTAMLVTGSCGIARPFGSADKLRQYLDRGQETPLRRRLEADAKSLFALYEYGRLHGVVRLRWGFLDEIFAAPWHDPDEPVLYTLLGQARALGLQVEAVVGAAPGWEDPWARAQLFHIGQGVREHDVGLIAVDDGYVVDLRDVQLARLATTIH